MTEVAHPGGEVDVSKHVLRGSAWFIAAIGLGAVGGFAFWWLAARLQPATIVGQASALFTVILFISYLTSLGLPVAVAKYGSLDHQVTHTLWSWALVFTTASSLIGALGFLWVAPTDLTQDLGSFGSWGFLAQLLFLFTMVNGMALALLVETRLVTLRAWGWMVGRVALLAIGRLPLLLVAPLASSAVGLVLLMAGAPALTGLVGVVALHYVTPQPLRQMRPLTEHARPAFRFATVNWLGMLAAQAPQFTVPLIIAAQVSSVENAAFYLAWSMTTVTFLVPQTVGQVVVSEGSRKGGTLDHKVRSGFMIALGAMTVLALGAVVFSPLATTIFGPSYELTGEILPALIGAGIPWAITALLLARARVLAQTGLTVAITVTFAVLGLGFVTVAAARSGLQGAAWGWLIANVLAAIAATCFTLVSHRRVKELPAEVLLPFDVA